MLAEKIESVFISSIPTHWNVQTGCTAEGTVGPEKK